MSNFPPLEVVGHGSILLSPSIASSVVVVGKRPIYNSHQCLYYKDESPSFVLSSRRDKR